MRNKCVYIHTLNSGRIFYIGIGSKRRAYSRYSRNRHWNNIVDDHKDYKVHVILEGLSSSEACAFEIFLISHVGLENLANISIGGEASAQGMKHSEETKFKMSINSAARNPEFKKKLSLRMSGCGNPMYGVNHSEDARNKIRNARIGSKASEETKLKMSNKRKGIKNSSYKAEMFLFRHENGCEIRCDRMQFRILTGIKSAPLSMLINKTRQTHKGWRIA